MSKNGLEQHYESIRETKKGRSCQMEKGSKNRAPDRKKSWTACKTIMAKQSEEIKGALMG